MSLTEDTVLCCSSCSCSGKFFWLNTLSTETTPLHRAGILWWGKLLFSRMSGGLGVLFPKGWVPPRPGVPRTQQEELCSLRQVEEGGWLLIISDAPQGVGEFRSSASGLGGREGSIVTPRRAWAGTFSSAMQSFFPVGSGSVRGPAQLREPSRCSAGRAFSDQG